MTSLYVQLVRRYSRLSSSWQILVALLAGLALFLGALKLGTLLGKALYHLTH